MTHSRWTLALFLCVSLTFAACSDTTETPAEDLTYQSILQTDTSGRVLGGDNSDFQPRAGQDSTGRLTHAFIAYPNATTENFITLRYQLPRTDTVTFAMIRPGVGREIVQQQTIPIALPDTSRGRSFNLQWNNPNARGFYRIEMRTRSGFFSFGDVQFQ
jgi:hypothetical protein